MSNPFHISIKEYNSSLPIGPYIPSEFLKKIDWKETIEEQAHKKARAILQHAEEEKTAILREAQLEAEKIKQNQQDKLEASLLERHVKWLLENKKIEDILVESVRQNIIQAITTVIRNWAGQQSIDEILVARLADKVEKLAKQGSLTLRVHPKRLSPVLHETFAHRLLLSEDETLDVNQAILASPLLSVDVCLDRHLSELIIWIEAASEGIAS